MKKIFLGLIIFIFFSVISLFSSNQVQAQSCGSSITCCQQVGLVPGPPGCQLNCGPVGNPIPGCTVCTFKSQCVSVGGSVNCHLSGNSCAQDAACPAGTYSGSCIYTPPAQPTCQNDGQCQINCCKSGTNHQDATCNGLGGYRCGPGSGGGNGACGGCNTCGAPQAQCALINGVCSKAGYCGAGVGQGTCNITPQAGYAWTGIFTVGQTFPLDVYVPGLNSDNDGVWGWGHCNDTNCTKTTNDPNLGSFNGRVFGSAPYKTIFTPLVAGTSKIHFYTQNDNGGAVQAQCDIAITVQAPPPPGPWWQITGNDAMTNGDLRSSFPNATPKFNLDGSGGFPGNALYNANTNLTTTNASSKGWVARSIYSGKTYDSSYFNSVLPSNIIINTVGNVASQSDFDSGTPSSDGYYYYKTAGSDLVLSSAIAMNKKAVLFVGGNLIINGNITIPNPGTNFFMIITTGNVNVNSSVTSLQGIFETDGNFNTGSSASALAVRGTIVTWGSVNWQRNLQGNNGTTPAETVTFDPTLITLFPRSLLQDNLSWQELLP